MTRITAIPPAVLALLVAGGAAADDGRTTVVRPDDGPTVTTVGPDEDADVRTAGEAGVEVRNVVPEEGAPLPGTLFVQSEQSILASTLTDVDVVNHRGEDIGDVADLLLYPSGELHGVLIEVGGFLGLGEKTIAVDFSRMEIVRDDDGDPVFRLHATEAEVDAAPAFVTLDEAGEVAEERAEELAREQAEAAEAPLERRAEHLEERADELEARADRVEERTEERVEEREEERIRERILE